MEKDETHTISVPEAARKYYGIKSRGAAYRAAASGAIITIRVGRLLRVPVAAMERKFANAGSEG